MKLPRETREYVPRLLAYKEILANPNAFGFRLPVTPNTPRLVEIHVNKPVNLVKAARAAGLASDTLTSLNPNFLKGVSIRGTTIKQRSKKRYKKRYASKSKRRGYKTHKVRRGDTLYRIAMRHGTTVNKLKRLNGIRSSRIKTGARLRLL